MPREQLVKEKHQGMNSISKNKGQISNYRGLCSIYSIIDVLLVVPFTIANQCLRFTSTVSIGCDCFSRQYN